MCRIKPKRIKKSDSTTQAPQKICTLKDCWRSFFNDVDSPRDVVSCQLLLSSVILWIILWLSEDPFPSLSLPCFLDDVKVHVSRTRSSSTPYIHLQGNRYTPPGPTVSRSYHGRLRVPGLVPGDIGPRFTSCRVSTSRKTIQVPSAYYPWPQDLDVHLKGSSCCPWHVRGRRGPRGETRTWVSLHTMGVLYGGRVKSVFDKNFLHLNFTPLKSRTMTGVYEGWIHIL